MGDAAFRLYWAGKDFGREPVPPSVLSCEADPEPLRAAERLRSGRALFAELRCLKCHDGGAVTPPIGTGLAELNDGAPSLDDAGARFNTDWVAAWILDPKKHRLDTMMPRLLRGEPQEAADIAAFLAALGQPAAPPKLGDELTAAGGRLFVDLQCIACHALPGHPAEAGAFTRVSLAFVKAKWQPAALVAFLKNPTEYHPTIRMPDFRLSEEEARALAGFLVSRDGESVPKTRGDAGRGKEFFERRGCLQCHAPVAGTTNRAVAAKALGSLDWTRGCLGETPADRGAAPDFALGRGEREALRTFGTTDKLSLQRDSLVESSRRQYAALRCAACHARDGKDSFASTLTDEIAALKSELGARENAEVALEESLDQDPPHLTWAGEKLKFDWLAKFIAGRMDDRPRPWLKMRMPAFGARGNALAQGLASEHGVLPEIAKDSAVDRDRAKLGARLAGNEGFNCTVCHAAGTQPAAAPFGAPGINFARVDERLRPEWFRRWMDNPPRISPSTKMPKFTDDDGRSKQSAVLGGDAHAQWDAIHEYFRRLREDAATK